MSLCPRFHPTEGTTAEHCCVPLCQAASKYNKYLAFTHFLPMRKLGKNGLSLSLAIIPQCVPISAFAADILKKDDVREPQSEGGRRLLKKGAVPVLFEWNNYSVYLPGPGHWKKSERPKDNVSRSEEEANRPAFLNDHDYASPYTPAVDPTLREEILPQTKHVEEQAVMQRFGIHRFVASDKDIRFFTRFASYGHLMRFWELIEPSLPFLINVTWAQRDTFTEQRVSTHSLQQIDEMFLFLNYLALGLKQQDLADRYGIDKPAVNRIITAWSNFLYVILGAVGIWLPVDMIVEHLPAQFMDYADTTVILDCIELRCQSPSSPLLQSEALSAYKSDCTLKGLIGVAPHGAVTFVSSLCAGSISDQRIIRESGILSLLTPGMAIMVDKEFLVDDLVPCKVYRPAFLSGTSQMSTCEVREPEAIACLRVHVERLIRQVKEHKFLDTEIPLQLFANVNQLYTVACLLTNYENGPLVKAKKAM